LKGWEEAAPIVCEWMGTFVMKLPGRSLMGSCQFQPGTREKITTILEGKRFWENPDDLPTKNWGTF